MTDSKHINTLKTKTNSRHSKEDKKKTKNYQTDIHYPVYTNRCILNVHVYERKKSILFFKLHTTCSKPNQLH